jgi:SAM-dependent methyltransferase
MTGAPWDASYLNGPAPWDIGQPQPAIVHLASAGGFAGDGPVLDVGCGTGENTLYIAYNSPLPTARRGLSVLGVDVAESALVIASEKAKVMARNDADANARRIKVEFAVADAFELQRLERTFQTVLDCGLFHTFDGNSDDNNNDDDDDNERPRYVASLAAVTEHDGTLYVLCFSDEGPETGPHPVSQTELRAAFNPSSGWNLSTIEAERIQTRFHANGAPAWLATIKRI